jgi:hypothetical protein
MCLYVCMCMYVCVCVCVCVFVYVYVCVNFSKSIIYLIIVTIYRSWIEHLSLDTQSHAMHHQLVLLGLFADLRCCLAT